MGDYRVEPIGLFDSGPNWNIAGTRKISEARAIELENRAEQRKQQKKAKVSKKTKGFYSEMAASLNEEMKLNYGDSGETSFYEVLGNEFDEYR